MWFGHKLLKKAIISNKNYILDQKDPNLDTLLAETSTENVSEIEEGKYRRKNKKKIFLLEK